MITWVGFGEPSWDTQRQNTRLNLTSSTMTITSGYQRMMFRRHHSPVVESYSHRAITNRAGDVSPSYLQFYPAHMRVPQPLNGVMMNQVQSRTAAVT